MSESMVERVARAIEQTYDLYSDPTPAQRARAAIAAMRHYTYDMEQAGMAAVERSEPFELVWNRVINVALASVAPKPQEPSSTTGGFQTQVFSQPRTGR